ncbi:pyridoxamine 5'-phosphate oxidase [Microbacterium sp. CFH 90308]|uniref:Pyridoxamine 5'-phosphate oxidase n=1 Tax=Microbacterium salsuginis TaxID=2722803 RepID=A0ABX1KD31_9MICO|nr:pyridoxamine 5'-phosphate oxidase family protein [Microbacterium sp. CFH 90308]NLP84941.1 pyridoxamine 5'-phosphate oxidase [Microbacterium sp. CFH 90308]
MTIPQGSIELLDTDIAQYLLQSTNLARVSYVAADGTPRVFPMLFHWTGQVLVLATFAGARKIEAIRRRPALAVTIDEPSSPPKALLLRGTATVVGMDGIVPEYRAMHHRYAGVDQGERNVAAVDRPGVKMARISLRPAWVGVLDFQTRFPGGTTAAEFENRG